MARKPLGLRPLRQPKAQPVRLADFTPREKLCFLSAWEPGWDVAARWESWCDYLSDYALVRDELSQKFGARFQCIGGCPFAERVLRFRDDFGAAALDTATYTEVHGYGRDA